MTGTYAVIGDPIDHSLSPNIHNAAFRELGMDCTYMAYRILRDELGAGIDSLKKIGISGFNVTIPHKVEVMRHLDETDNDCTTIGAANTVAVTDGVLRGYNTDAGGFLDPILRRKISLSDQTVLLLGAGGAARAAVSALARAGVSHITIANRSADGADGLAQFAAGLGTGSSSVNIEGAGKLVPRHKFIVNCTPVGMGDGACPINTESITPDSIIYDMVYSPINTGLIKAAKKAGAAVIYGYEMLLGQACRSFEIWHGRDAPYDVMRRAILGGPP